MISRKATVSRRSASRKRGGYDNGRGRKRAKSQSTSAKKSGKATSSRKKK